MLDVQTACAHRAALRAARARAATRRRARRHPLAAPRSTPAERERAVADDRWSATPSRATACAASAARPTYWFGVVEGLLKMSNDNARRRARSPSPACRRAAGSARARCSSARAYRYNIQALRRSVVAGLPVDDLPLAAGPQHRLQPLRDEPAQRTARPVHRRARDRPHEQPRRCAWRAAWRRCSTRCCIPGVGELLRITQQELAYLVGPVAPARQRGADALGEKGLIRVEYGGVRVLDLAALQRARPRWRELTSRRARLNFKQSFKTDGEGWPLEARSCTSVTRPRRASASSTPRSGGWSPRATRRSACARSPRTRASTTR